jgi:hypothetical protein
MNERHATLARLQETSSAENSRRHRERLQEEPFGPPSRSRRRRYRVPSRYLAPDNGKVRSTDPPRRPPRRPLGVTWTTAGKPSG